MELPKPEWFPAAIRSACWPANRSIPALTAAAFRDLLSGRVEEAYASAFLDGTPHARAKPPAEIATAARTLREQMIRNSFPFPAPWWIPAVPAATTSARSTSAPPRRSSSPGPACPW